MEILPSYGRKPQYRTTSSERPNERQRSGYGSGNRNSGAPTYSKYDKEFNDTYQRKGNVRVNQVNAPHADRNRFSNRRVSGKDADRQRATSLDRRDFRKPDSRNSNQQVNENNWEEKASLRRVIFQRLLKFERFDDINGLPLPELIRLLTKHESGRVPSTDNKNQRPNLQ